MARAPHLQVVAQTNNNHKAGSWQGEDNVLFHKTQVVVGTRLVNYGRKRHGEVWEVTALTTYRILKSGRAVPVPTDHIVHLTDDVTMRRLGSSEHAQRIFSGLSYSAVWRLA